MIKNPNIFGFRCRRTYQNPTTGSATIELHPQLWENIEEYQLERGRYAREEARRFRLNSRGLVTVQIGLGYDVIDQDILGGDGTGARREDYLQWFWKRNKERRTS